MKRMSLIGLTALLISLLTFGQTIEKSVQSGIQEEWTSLNENGYSIQYPKNWDLDKSGQMGTSFIVLSQLSSQQDQFRENVNLLIQDLTGMNIDLDKYVEISEGQIRTMITNGKLLDSKRQSSNGTEFHKVIFTGDQGIYQLKFEQYYLIKNGKAYVLTLTCEINQYDKYKEIGEQILSSFKLN